MSDYYATREQHGWETDPEDAALVAAINGETWDEETLVADLRARGWYVHIDPINHRYDPFGPEWKARVSVRPSILQPHGEGWSRQSALIAAAAEAYRQEGVKP